MNIRELFDKKKCVFSFEMFPPKKESADMGAMLDTVNGLKKLSPDYISITYGAGGKALPEDEITMDDDLPNGKDVDADEAADAGFEIQDEDDVFGLLNDSYTMDSDADSENE